MTNDQVHNVLLSIKDMINIDLLPLFDSFSVDYVPTPTYVYVDWITYIKSTSFNPSSPSFDSKGFSDFLANANYLNSLYADKTALAICLANPVSSALFFASPCITLLPFREVSISVFNAEVMSGKIYIVSWKPYNVVDEYPSIYWELQKRFSGTPILRVYRHAGQDCVFNPVGLLMNKETLGNFYSNISAYGFETTSMLRVLSV